MARRSLSFLTFESAHCRTIMNQDPSHIPPRLECPQRFCFFWVPRGGWKDVSGRVYKSLEEALRDGTWVTYEEGACGCSFGVCSRSGEPGEARDWYEPCEPELDRAGLPHDYFRSSEGGEAP